MAALAPSTNTPACGPPHPPASPTGAALPLRPCQHCGTPTRARSNGYQGWPACPDCYAAWEQRPEEQRRREQRAKAITRRERERRQARRTRLFLERQG